MKKYISLFLCLVLCFLFVSCGKSQSNENLQNPTSDFTNGQTEENEIRIGVFEVQNGTYKLGSEQSILGIKYANLLTPEITINQNKYKIKLDVVSASTDYSTKSVREAAQKLVQDKVKAVIGFYNHDLLSKCADIFEKAKIPVICTNGCSVKASENYTNIFSLCADDYEQAKASADFAYNKIMSRKAVIVSKLNDESSTSQALYFKEFFESYGGKTKLLTLEDEIDLSALGHDYSLIFAPLSQSDTTELLEECEANNISISVILGSSADNGVTLSKSQNRAFPIYLYSHFVLDGNSVFYNNLSAYISKDKDFTQMNGGNSIVSSASALSFDAYNIFVNAITKSQSAGEFALIDSLKSLEMTGETGLITFDLTGKRLLKNASFKKSDNYQNIWYEIV